jgi:Flp pilus assembly protein CpaB
VSRRRRAILFAVAAAVCAALAARSVSGYSQGVEAQLGPLRSALVARMSLPAKRVLRPSDLRRLEVRRVPERFVPPGVLQDPAEAVGHAPATTIPAGAYVLGAQLTVPGSKPTRRPPLDAGRTPVEIPVAGAAALASQLSGSARPLVDVIVTSEPRSDSGEGRTYVAVSGVRLLDLRAADPNAGADVAPALPDVSIATLALSRAQALSLIHAQNFARELRLVAASR